MDSRGPKANRTSGTDGEESPKGMKAPTILQTLEFSTGNFGFQVEEYFEGHGWALLNFANPTQDVINLCHHI